MENHDLQLTFLVVQNVFTLFSLSRAFLREISVRNLNVEVRKDVEVQGVRSDHFSEMRLAKVLQRVCIGILDLEGFF